MSIRLKTPSDFDAYLMALYHELFDANTHFHIFSALVKSLKEFQDEIDHSPIFWKYTIRAHIDSAMVHLCRIYDDNASATHLPHLLETVKRHPDIFDTEPFKQRLRGNPSRESLAAHYGKLKEQELDNDIAFCSESNPLVAKLRKWRNHIIAHKNKGETLSGKPFHEKVPLPFDEIQKLIDEGFSVLDRCGGYYKATSFSRLPMSQGVKDYRTVLESLKTTLRIESNKQNS